MLAVQGGVDSTCGVPATLAVGEMGERWGGGGWEGVKGYPPTRKEARLDGAELSFC